MRRSIALLSVLAVFGAPGRGIAADDKLAHPEARAYVFPQCILSREAPPAPPPDESTSDESKRGTLRKAFLSLGADLLSGFAGPVVNLAYSGLVSALKKAGEDKKVDQAFAVAPFYLYSANVSNDKGKKKIGETANLGCVLLVHGDFVSKETAAIQKPGIPPSCKVACRSGGGDECRSCLAGAGIPVAKIGLLYEAGVELSEDRTAFVYQSKYLTISYWLQAQRSDRKHKYAVTLSLLAPGSKDDDKVISTSVLDLGDRERGVVYNNENNDKAAINAGSGWLGGIALEEIDKARLKDLAEAGKGSRQLRPVTLHASLNEAIAGSPLAAKLAELLDGAKADVTKTLTAAISPAEIAKAKEKAASDLESDRTAEETSYGKLLDAKIAKEKADNPKPSEAVKLDFAIEAARRAWCRDVAVMKMLGETPPARNGESCP